MGIALGEADDYGIAVNVKWAVDQSLLAMM